MDHANGNKRKLPFKMRLKFVFILISNNRYYCIMMWVLSLYCSLNRNNAILKIINTEEFYFWGKGAAVIKNEILLILLK
jgi:hypothetical protein